jgi:hypothetical protein
MTTVPAVYYSQIKQGKLASAITGSWQWCRRLKKYEFPKNRGVKHLDVRQNVRILEP